MVNQCLDSSPLIFRQLPIQYILGWYNQHGLCLESHSEIQKLIGAPGSIWPLRGESPEENEGHSKSY
jgi:hypothetical protein